ncbi:MAG: hypothetical protein JKY81_01520 [Colwellia sp.]|nr:hypothetical protein [Colwellia sp.]
MFTAETYFYLFALLSVTGFSGYRLFKNDDYLRLFASLIMLLAWTSIMISQNITQDFTPVGMFVFIDFVTVVTFAWLAFSYNKLWLWWVSAFHTFSLALNAVYVLGGQENAYLYLSLMTGLSYLSLLWIVTGEGILQGVGRGVKSVFTLVNPSLVRSSRDSHHES